MNFIVEVLLWGCGGSVALIALVYLIVRVGSIAHFRTKREFERKQEE
jgi:hypothetical protein